MAKRSKFERNPRDYYITPYEAIIPLLPHLPEGTKFCEPCAGDGSLVRHLEKHGHRCIYACDIEPQSEGIETQDILFFGFKLPPCDLIISNTPWERNRDGTGPLHEMIEALRIQAPFWNLFDADWLFTDQSKPFRRFLKKIVPVGRLSWMDNGVDGMDSCCWYLFGNEECETIFV